MREIPRFPSGLMILAAIDGSFVFLSDMIIKGLKSISDTIDDSVSEVPAVGEILSGLLTAIPDFFKSCMKIIVLPARVILVLLVILIILRIIRRVSAKRYNKNKEKLQEDRMEALEDAVVKIADAKTNAIRSFEDTE